MVTMQNETSKVGHVSANDLEIVECQAGVVWPTPASGIFHRKDVADAWLREVQGHSGVVYVTKNYRNLSGKVTWIAAVKVSTNKFGEVAP